MHKRGIVLLTSNQRLNHWETVMHDLMELEWLCIGNYLSLTERIRQNDICCILVDWKHVPWLKSIQILHLKELFSHIRWIAVLTEDSIESAWQCGKLQMDRVVRFERSVVSSMIRRYLEKEELMPSFEDLSIDIYNPEYSPLLRKTLVFIEKFYVEIKSIRYLAGCLGISECVLTREFQTSDLNSPKKVLMNLKLNYAVRLMRVKGFNNANISRLAGFSNSKVMSEYFKREFNMLPSEYRFKYITDKIEE